MRFSRTSLLFAFLFCATGGPLQAQQPESGTTAPVEVYIWGQQPHLAFNKEALWGDIRAWGPRKQTAPVINGR